MAYWTREEVLIALNLYCQLPFGKLHHRNPQIIELARRLGRTSSSLAMKLSNLASLDPAITATGRKGLLGASALDKSIWDEFQKNPDVIGYESQRLMDELASQSEELIALTSATETMNIPAMDSGITTTATAIVTVRVKQSFFRKAVLSSYENCCCMSGIRHPYLLIASHIVPWAKDVHNRLNPTNGLCLSALHDKAFDRGLLTVLPDFTIRVASELKQDKSNLLMNDYLLGLEGKSISMPNKFAPDKLFLSRHNEEVFLG